MALSYWIFCFQLLAVALCERIEAECLLAPNSEDLEVDLSDNLYGEILFSQESESDAVSITIEMEGFNTTDNHTLHGLNIHADPVSEDYSEGCAGTGGHYNPDGNTHGGPDANTDSRHAGDLGNVEEDENGTVSTTMTDSYISLQGDYNVIGRAVVVHQMEDTLDESIDASGGAGTRIACCTIEQVHEVITEDPDDVAGYEGSAHESFVSMTSLLSGLIIAIYLHT